MHFAFQDGVLIHPFEDSLGVAIYNVENFEVVAFQFPLDILNAVMQNDGKYACYISKEEASQVLTKLENKDLIRQVVDDEDKPFSSPF